jgi:hypothetical protein
MMGRRLENWLSKASTRETRKAHAGRWRRFAKWVTTTVDPLTGKVYMTCKEDEVDDFIRTDFEEMANHLFQDRYKDVLTKYLVSLKEMKANSARNFVASVRAFFSSECTPIRLAKGKIPASEMAENEHRLSIEELREMYRVADTEGKARLSVALSLGWGVSDFLGLQKDFIQDAMERADKDGFATFDYRRVKTRARIFGILTPDAVNDLKRHLRQIPEGQASLWSFGTKEGVGAWFKKLFKEAGLENGIQKLRFHLIRKFVFDTVSSKCGIYEAKLLVGKKIALADATYLHGLQDRLLKKYKAHAWPLLRLDTGGEAKTDEKVNQLSEMVTDLTKRLVAKELEAREMFKRLVDVSAEVKDLKHELDGIKVFTEGVDGAVVYTDELAKAEAVERLRAGLRERAERLRRLREEDPGYGRVDREK